ncbi:MAG: type I-E CRISPR-associated endonuclease Cas1e [Chthoniobacterales bacterium]
MPLFERPPLETLASAKDRWTPIYLEHGRLEVDDSSVKWIGADGLLCRIPVATVAALILGPGTAITHAAVRACAESNTPICWTGAEGMRFYAFGLAPNHTNDMPRLHAAAWADRKRRTAIARRMFRQRFPEIEVEGRSVKELRGMEGLRVRTLYAQLGLEHGVTWKGRNYDRSNWDISDEINQALSAANASLYALCAAVICSLGYLPSLGFVHEAGTLPFVYDVADLYKHLTSMPAAFRAARQHQGSDGELVRKLLKQLVEEQRILQRMPKDLAALFQTEEANPESAGGRPPSAIT